MPWLPLPTSMERLDFSRQSSSPSAESLSNDNILLFTVYYVLQYKIGTWYMVPVPGSTAVLPFRQPRPNNDGAAGEMQLLPQEAPGLGFFFDPQ